MRKLKIIVPLLLVLAFAGVVGAFEFVQMATHTGITVVAAAPESLVPAGADMYLSLDRSGDQGAGLDHLWQAYQAHPGTSAALSHLRAAMRMQSSDSNKMHDLFSTLGDHTGLAVWMPPVNRPNDTHVAIVTQLKVMDLLQGKGPLRSLATVVPVWSYQGTRVYKVTFKHGAATPAFACIVSSNGVLATDAATIKRVIDTATGHAPALSTNKDYNATLAALPASHMFTVYLASSVSSLMRKEMKANAGSMPRSVQSALPDFPVRPYGIAMSVSNDGLAFSTTALPSGSFAANVTSNEAAAEVGGNTVLYTSQGNLAANLAPLLRLAPADTIAQMEGKLGINLHRDILSWMNGEFAITFNDSSSPLMAQAARGMVGGSGGNVSAAPAGSPQLPGSVALAWHVDDPSAVRQSLDRIAAAVEKAMGATSPLVSPVALSGGEHGYMIAAMPGLGYGFRDKWLIASSNLSADLTAPKAPLSADAAYTTDLRHVAGAGSLTGVSYINLTRLFGAVDRWISFVDRSRNGLASQAAQSIGWTWPRAESLIAPLHSVIFATHTDGKAGMRIDVFVAIAS